MTTSGMVTVQRATPADYEAFLRFFGQLGMPADFPVPNKSRWEVYCENAIFLESANGRVAYAAVQITGKNAYVLHVAVDATHRGNRLGSLLMKELAARARLHGCTEWAVHVKADNTPAVRLYEASGMRVVRDTVTLEVPWAFVETKVDDDRNAATVRAVEPSGAEDAALERTFALAPGQLGTLRQSSTRVFVCVVERGAYVGLAVFDTLFVGAHPFEVAHPGVARMLLRQVRLHAHEPDTSVKVVVEGNSALITELESGGAREVQRLRYLRGPIG